MTSRQARDAHTGEHMNVSEDYIYLNPCLDCVRLIRFSTVRLLLHLVWNRKK